MTSPTQVHARPAGDARFIIFPPLLQAEQNRRRNEWLGEFAGCGNPARQMSRRSAGRAAPAADGLTRECTIACGALEPLMQMFEYVIVLISIVIGLALTHLMQRIAGLI